MNTKSPLPQRLDAAFHSVIPFGNASYCGRFAPSPTGPLHVGNLRTALISWLRARLCGGKWLLRIDDLDIPRNKSGAIQGIQSDLLWLGLNWDDQIFFQSNRRGLYYSVLSYLRKQNKLFPCRCSRKLLAKSNNFVHGWKIYPGTCRSLNLSWGEEDGRLPSWRLKVENNFSRTAGDVLVRRSDGLIAYNFATVVDELTLGVNEVVRGNDLRNGVCPQLAILSSLSQRSINYCHLPIMRNKDGTKISKRTGGISLNSLKAQGMNSQGKVVGWLASTLGLVPIDTELTSLELLNYLKDYNIKELFETSFASNIKSVEHFKHG